VATRVDWGEIRLAAFYGPFPKTPQQMQLESSHSPQVLPPRWSYSPGGVTIFALPAVPLCPIYCNGNEKFKVIQNPGFLPDHAQNWITGSLCRARHTLKISERSVHNFSSYLVYSQTNKQTNKNQQKRYLLGRGKKSHRHLLHKPSYSQFCPKFRCHFNGGLSGI